MIDGLKFYKLITLEEVYQDYLSYLRRFVPMDTSFKSHIETFEDKGYRIQ